MKRYRRLRDHGMDRRICIHGHFYQPPRENPWLGSVEFQASAVTHHDWNERITSEAYWPNCAARIYNDDMSQAHVANNYAHMSFNFGPTLLSWMASEARPCYDLILEADRISRRLFDGHGSALAQAYNHMIMPLANSRDKFTQVYWGIRDFEYRFGRSPRGMWLGESAVDLETLDIMASQGIQFTVLAPGQAARVRPLNQPLWRELHGTGIDPRQPYVQKLPSGRNITIFFYDGPLSQGVAFESLLNRGETFAHRLMEGFTESSLPQLVHIATDGETYGHHHRFGEMALARALWYLEEQGLTSVANYSQFMDLYPPTHAVEIREDSSWSCFHGVERWRSDCGCQTGGDPHWNQAWREPLREALDWLRDHIASMFEADREGWFEDPWRARNDFIEVILEEVTPLGFMRDQEKRDLSDQEREQALKALEAQRLAMFMFTSCGWFFNDLNGIETHQVLLYAARAIELAEEVYGVSLEEEFLDRLERAQSNVESAGSGRQIFLRAVQEAKVSAIDLARHGGFALDADQHRSLEFPSSALRIRDDDVSHGDAGKLWLGRIEVISRLTGETQSFDFARLDRSGHQPLLGLQPHTSSQDWRRRLLEALGILGQEDFENLFSLALPPVGLEKGMLPEHQKLYDALEDGRCQVRDTINWFGPGSKRALSLIASWFPTAPWAKQLMEANTLALDLEKLLNKAGEPEAIQDLLNGGAVRDMDSQIKAQVFRKVLEVQFQNWSESPEDSGFLEKFLEHLAWVGDSPFRFESHHMVNLYELVREIHLSRMSAMALRGNEKAELWVEKFQSLGDYLGLQRTH